jgi:hypothetical protein
MMILSSPALARSSFHSNSPCPPTPPQNRMLYHPEIPRIPRDPAGNPARYRHPGESYYDMPYDDEEVAFPSFLPSMPLLLPLPLASCRLLACLASFPADWCADHEEGGWVPLSAFAAEQVVAEDGVKLHCWFIRQPKPQDCATIIFFQENAVCPRCQCQCRCHCRRFLNFF